MTRVILITTGPGAGNAGGAAGGAAAGGGGEAPLSFRRFLEPPGGGGLARPDVAAGLPDFVQDHLAPAAGAGAAARDTRDWQSPAAAAAATGTRRKVGGPGVRRSYQSTGLCSFLVNNVFKPFSRATAGSGMKYYDNR